MGERGRRARWEEGGREERGLDEGGGGEMLELRAKSPGGKDIEFVMLQMFVLD